MSANRECMDFEDVDTQTLSEYLHTLRKLSACNLSMGNVLVTCKVLYERYISKALSESALHSDEFRLNLDKAYNAMKVIHYFSKKKNLPDLFWRATNALEGLETLTGKNKKHSYLEQFLYH